MKLPKQFGGGGLTETLAKAKQAMERAKALESELEDERIEVVKGPVKAVFNGTGMLQTISIEPSAVDPNDLEMLEDLLVGAVRDGFAQATALREKRLAEIMPDLPPGLSF
jgi:hypothetical protein